MTPPVGPISLRQLAFRASLLARVQTYLALAAFLGALLIGCVLHYKRIVKNGVAGYPEEWFPSVSATIGDWYPERNVFQILIALNSGPRFALICLQYYLHRTTSSSLPGIVAFCGVLRTLTCGGWVYITSTDDHDAHDILMISYIVLNIPWMFGSIACTSPQNTLARRRRRAWATVFFTSMIPMIYFFIQHKVHRIPGAYTRYSFFEWSLIIFDIMYDSTLELELRATNLQVAVFAPSTTASQSDAANIQVVSQTVPLKAILHTAEAVVIPKVKVTQNNEPAASDRSPKWRSGVAYASDIYQSYIFWSIITSLTPTLFYFSVWELGIAGHESALLSTMSPCLLAIPPVLRACRSHSGWTILHLLSLSGIAAYALNSPLQRLLAVSFACAVASIGAAADWSSKRGVIGHKGVVLCLGLILSSIAKHANHSNNPVWPFVHEHSGGYNKTGLAIACLSILESYVRPMVSDSIGQANPRANVGQASAQNDAWLSGGVALGSLLFFLHYLLGDSSTMIAWSWTGYPLNGPVPHLHGSLTHVAQACGLAIPLILGYFPSRSSLMLHPLWLAYGSSGAYVMYNYRDWLGYAGGLNFAVFLMSVTPAVLERAANTGHVAKTFSLAWLVVSLFHVSSVFTAAYAFVPGGAYFRERTDLVLIVGMTFMALAFHWPGSNAILRVPSLRLSAPSGTFARSTLSLLTVLSLLVTLYRWPMVLPQPRRAGARLVRTGIWTVHFGIDNEGRDSQRRMRDLIGDMELDVVGLLETDLHRTVFGNRDLTRVMVEELGYYVDIGPGPNSHTWGAVLLSKFPIVNSTHHLLPSPDGELAPAIEADLDMYGTIVKVVVAHNGQEETPLDRELQASELARIMSNSYPDPVIFLGYVVTKPLAARPAPYNIMVTDGRVHDIDQRDWDRWCEYIFYRGLYRTAYARVSRSTITDTELQIGQFVLPRHGFSVTADAYDARYLRVEKEDLPEDHWFPTAYYPKQGGRRGHQYHVFDAPLFYKIPEGAVL